jgi:hypothetical protein
MSIMSRKKGNILRPWQSTPRTKESILCPWQSHTEKGKYFTSTTIMWRLGAEIELSVEIERLNHAQDNHVHSFYIHNIHRWSNVFALLHVTAWIWIEMEGNLISIIDD